MKLVLDGVFSGLIKSLLKFSRDEKKRSTISRDFFFRFRSLLLRVVKNDMKMLLLLLLDDDGR